MGIKGKDETMTADSDSAFEEPKLSPGTVLPKKDKKYTLEDLIGRGSMASVYRATDHDFSMRVALKILHKRYYSDLTVIERFYQEARAAATLNHTNIARVYNIGEFDGLHCISMEHIDGRTLKEELEQRKTPYSIEDACEIIMPVLSALDYAHKHKDGIVHRDVKPGNIMIRDKDKQVKLLDFGIAKILEKENQPALQLTEIGTYLGTIQFMSPEQMISSREATQKSDVFSAGVILYRMLTGQLPFGNDKAEGDTEAMVNIIKEKLICPSQVNPRLSKEVDYILSKALEKDPEKRYSAGELLTDLGKLVRKEPVTIEKGFKPEFYVDPRIISRKRFIKLGAGVCIISFLLSVGGWFYTKRYDDIGSIIPVVKEIESPEIDTMEELVPKLIKLYPRFRERGEWFYNKDFRKRIESEKEKILKGENQKNLIIHALGTLTAEGYLGRFTYLSGEGTYAGEMAPFLYSLYDDMIIKARNEKDPEKRLKLEKKCREIMDNAILCATNLSFAEHSDLSSGTAISDRTARAVHRFHPPYAEFIYNLKNDYPKIYYERKDDVQQTKDNYAKAMKMAIEHVVRKTIENVKEYSSWNDSEFALLLCDGFRLLDIKEQVLSSYEYLGNKTKSVYDFIDLIIMEADEKIEKLVRDESWRQNVSNNEYFGLMEGLIERKIFLRDILNEEDTKFSNNELFRKNIGNLTASSDQPESKLREYLSNTIVKLDQVIQEMGSYGIPILFNSLKPEYYLEQRPENPLSIYHLRYLLGLNSIYDNLNYGNISKEEVDCYILKTILNREHVVKDLSKFRGFFKNTIPFIDHKASIGGTNIAFERSVYKYIREIAH